MNEFEKTINDAFSSIDPDKEKIMIAIALGDHSRAPKSLFDSQNWIADAWRQLDSEEREAVNKYREMMGKRRIGPSLPSRSSIEIEGRRKAKKIYEEITERIYQLAQCSISLEQKRRYLIAVQAKADIYLSDKWID